ncbi:hypothetical protein TPHV1_20053 [Treponema phagedenis]|uniref:Uncharacterized protein n=1 Tax=Treponema phagedenis TaxID=162 RepID=A0A0B7GY29_TREPH|nr:hypothetical protein TPHV1_20053 [Treponema phagedenis]
MVCAKGMVVEIVAPIGGAQEATYGR